MQKYALQDVAIITHHNISKTEEYVLLMISMPLWMEWGRLDFLHPWYVQAQHIQVSQPVFCTVLPLPYSPEQRKTPVLGYY